ncbi:MAG: exodeoxyribonuclease VII small subunit [Clostridia bacterium]|nr:exodeoxyribonuclease VII small subunit [Clostridia bacterium]
MNDFEKMMAELNEITDKLESGELSLADSMALFEKGVELTRKCGELLNEAKQKIVKITEDSDGNIKEEPFDVEEA